MFSGRSLLVPALLLPALTLAFTLPAEAQGFINKKRDLGDGSHFYMSRLQVQLIDDSPVVTHQAGTPGAAQAPINVPRVLPRSGFQSYTSSMPQLSTSLPRVNNGVPPKQAPVKAPPRGAHGKTGSLLRPTEPRPAAPQTVQSYAPYKGFSPGTAGSTAGSGYASAGQSQTNVRGNVLHWAHRHSQ
jgi:hypothetical protein